MEQGSQADLPTVVYDSRTGNVQRFVNRLKKEKNWTFIRITPQMEIKGSYHLLTYTTGIGAVPESTRKFVENNPNVVSVSSSGNMNWGQYYGVAADYVAEKNGCDVLMKFELSGTQRDVDEFIARVQKLHTQGHSCGVSRENPAAC